MNPFRFHRRTAILALTMIALMGGVLRLGWSLYEQKREHSQDVVIAAAAARYGMDPALIKAVIWRESWFDPWARGRAGEIGLMQICEDASREWADAEHVRGFEHAQLFDPGRNTLAGTWYLRKLLRRYATTDNPLPYALADYNAGRANALRWARDSAATNSADFVEAIGFPGTKAYVKAILSRYARYKAP